ncbi:MAG: hypothetical protein Q7J68_07695 [Thermoplasmata archaeon]|nr:hypothetical protein [Thermoplasmata archaeon]
MPVDNYVIKEAKGRGISSPCKKWSRWDEPRPYREYQTQLRKMAEDEGKLPLELEDKWWVEEQATRNKL